MQQAVEEREQAKHAPQPDQPVLSGDRAQGRDRQRQLQDVDGPVAGRVRQRFHRIGA